MREVGRCPLWVNSGHFAKSDRCPLYPRKQTLLSANGMSAKLAGICSFQHIGSKFRANLYSTEQMNGTRLVGISLVKSGPRNSAK